MKNFHFNTCLILVCFTVLTCSLSCSKDDSQENIEKQEANAITNKILELVNVHRTAIGKSSLSKNNLATQLAENHTKYMIQTNISQNTIFYQHVTLNFDLILT